MICDSMHLVVCTHLAGSMHWRQHAPIDSTHLADSMHWRQHAPIDSTHLADSVVGKRIPAFFFG